MLILIPLQVDHDNSLGQDWHPMDKLMAKLSEQQAILNQQNVALKSGDDDGTQPGVLEQASSSNSLPITPATDAFPSTTPSTRPASALVGESASENDEVLRLKLQLAQAQTQITKLDQELAHTRVTKPNLEPQGLGVHRSTKVATRENTSWGIPEDARSDTSDALSATAFNHHRIWGNSKTNATANVTQQMSITDPLPAPWTGNRVFSQPFTEHSTPYPSMDGYRTGQNSPDPDVVIRPPSNRRGSRYDNRTNAPSGYNNGYGAFGTFNGGTNHYEPLNGSIANGPMNIQPGPAPLGLGMGMYAPYQQQQPVGTPLSPHASEFTSKSEWKTEVSLRLGKVSVSG